MHIQLALQIVEATAWKKPLSLWWTLKADSLGQSMRDPPGANALATDWAFCLISCRLLPGCVEH